MEIKYYNKNSKLVGYLKRGELGTQYVSVKPRTNPKPIKTSLVSSSHWWNKKSFNGNVDKKFVLL